MAIELIADSESSLNGDTIQDQSGLDVLLRVRTLTFRAVVRGKHSQKYQAQILITAALKAFHPSTDSGVYEVPSM